MNLCTAGLKRAREVIKRPWIVSIRGGAMGRWYGIAQMDQHNKRGVLITIDVRAQSPTEAADMLVAEFEKLNHGGAR